METWAWHALLSADDLHEKADSAQGPAPAGNSPVTAPPSHRPPAAGVLGGRGWGLNNKGEGQQLQGGRSQGLSTHRELLF